MAGVYRPRHPERTVLYRVLLFHPHLHFLITEGGVDEAGLFHKVSRIDDSRLASLFAREVLTDLVRIINHHKLTFAAERPPPPHIADQEVLVAAEASGEYFS